jgi:uncharacterized protein (TIGR02284 family)
MADNSDELIGVLNDLIRINHDRTDGYRKAVEELKPADLDLKTLFTNMANTSLQYANTLSTEVRNHGGTPATSTTQAGKFYRLWMDIRSTLAARDRKSVLSLCEFGEDAALRAYETALSSSRPLPPEVRTLLEEQRQNVQTSRDVVKRYREMHETVS